jgi:hypothetical protein
MDSKRSLRIFGVLVILAWLGWFLAGGSEVAALEASVKVSVQHYYPESYFLGISVTGEGITSVNVIGPNITKIEQCPQDPRHTVVSLSRRPNIGDTYTIHIGYSNGRFMEVKYIVDGINDNFAWIISPPDGGTVSTLTPTFTWRKADNISYYHLKVVDDEGNWIWQISLPQSITSVVYNIDGTATAELQSGKRYKIALHTLDEKGHQATTMSSFTVELH